MYAGWFCPTSDFTPLKPVFVKIQKSEKNVFQRIMTKWIQNHEIFSNKPKMLLLVRESSSKIFGLLLPPVLNLLRFMLPKYRKIQNFPYNIVWR